MGGRKAMDIATKLLEPANKVDNSFINCSSSYKRCRNKILN